MSTTEKKEYLGWLSKINSVVVFVCAYLVFGAICLGLFGAFPKTTLGWTVGVIIGPILFVLHEGIGALYWEGLNKIPAIKKIRDDVEKETEGEEISGLRISYVLFEILVFGGVLFVGGMLIYKLSGDTFDPVISFFRQNFY